MKNKNKKLAESNETKSTFVQKVFYISVFFFMLEKESYEFWPEVLKSFHVTECTLVNFYLNNIIGACKFHLDLNVALVMLKHHAST